MTFPNRLLLADSQLKTIRLGSSVFYLFSSEICGSRYVNSPPPSAVSKDPQSQRLTCINSSPRSCSRKERLKNDFSSKLSVRPRCQVRTAALPAERANSMAKRARAVTRYPRCGKGPLGDAGQRRGSGTTSNSAPQGPTRNLRLPAQKNCPLVVSQTLRISLFSVHKMKKR